MTLSVCIAGLLPLALAVGSHPGERHDQAPGEAEQHAHIQPAALPGGSHGGEQVGGRGHDRPLPVHPDAAEQRNRPGVHRGRGENGYQPAAADRGN